MASKTLTEVTELAKIVQTLAPKRFLDWANKTNGREARIFRRVIELEVALSEEDIARELSMENREFQKALSALKARLFEVTLDLELPAGRYSDYARRLYALDRAHARLRILVRLEAAFTANEEAKYWFEEAKMLEEWPVAISILSPLLTWASLSGNKEIYDTLNSELARLRKLSAALADANEVSERINMVFAKSGAEHPELSKIIRPAIELLEPVVRELGTFRLSEALLLLRRKAQQVTMDYDEALAICVEMDALLVQYPLFANRSRKSRNALAKLMCHVQMKHRERALEVAESSLDLFNKGGQNWHSFQEWRFVLFMHTKQFSQGYELVRQVMSLPRFSAQAPATRDAWNLFLRYAEYFTGQPVSDALLRRNEQAGELHRRIMDQFPTFKGDYAGREMAAIVLEILIVLKRHVADLFLRTESLKNYKIRPLREGEEAQSNIFIDLLRLLETHDLDRAKILEEAGPMVERMRAIKTIDPVQSQQILPYETLWELVVERLPRN